MASWTKETEEELTLLIKDWLKAQGKTQSDLGRSLKTSSSRMPALIEVLKAEFKKGGMTFVAAKLCWIEKEWSTGEIITSESLSTSDPFSQLDLILQELKDKSSEKN